MAQTVPWWLFWAFLSATFAALTAILAKLGVEGLDSDLATLIRTAVILCVLSVLLVLLGKLKNIDRISGRTWLFLVLSGLDWGILALLSQGAQTGGCRARRPDRQTQRGAGGHHRRLHA